MSYEYNWEDYNRIIGYMLDNMWRDPGFLEIGDDISDIPEVKIIFDGYGDLDGETYIEQGDKNSESYAIFIHKNAGDEGFEFPEHDMTPWCLIHRPDEEVCIYAWYDVEKDEWYINALEETSEHKMTDEEVMNVLYALEKRYYSEAV